MALMLSGLRFFLLLPLGALLACGSSLTPSSGGVVVTAGAGAPTGDWILTVAPGTAGSSTFVGALTVTGTKATGVFRLYSIGGACVSTSQDIPFTGSVVNSVLTLTSGVYSGSTATATIQLPLINNTAGIQNASGTLVVAGGTCALSSSPLTAAYVPDATGTWAGSLAGPVNGTVSLALSESAANVDGQFPTTATITFTGSTCSAAVSVSGLFNGYSLQLTDTRTTPDTASFSTSTTPAAFSMSLASGATCPVGSYTGTLTHQ